MFKSRLAALGLACLVSGACTVVIQQAPEQPEPASVPRSTEPEPPPRQTPVRRGQGSLGIAPGHLPGPGYCRVWVEGTPPGHQARARACEGILPYAPQGSWVLYRAALRQQEIRVRYLHESKHGMVIAVRVYEARSGRYLRDLALGEDDDNMGPARPTISQPTTPVRRPSENQGGRRGNAAGQADTTRNRGNAGENRGRGNEGVKADTVSARGQRGRGGDDERGREADRRGGDDERGREADRRGNNAGQADSTKSNRGNAGENRGRGNEGVKADTVSARGRQGRGEDDERGREADRRGNNAGQADTTSNKRSGQQAGGQINRRGGDEERGRETDDQPGRRGGDDETRLATDAGVPLGIDARYFPRDGQCRLWVPGRPNGRQARAASCDAIANGAPAGAMILRRSPNQPNVLLVDYIDEARAGRIVRTSLYDANSGVFIRDEQGQRR